MTIDKIIQFNEFEKLGHKLKSSYCQNQSNKENKDDFFGFILYENNIYTSAKNCNELLDIMKYLIETLKRCLYENYQPTKYYEN